MKYALALLFLGSFGCAEEEPRGRSYPSSGGSTVCGNNLVEAGEQCDGTATRNTTCEGLGFGAGVVRCEPTCKGFDLAACAAPASCGDGIIDAPVEKCDGATIGVTSCESLGYGPGALTCMTNCGGFVTAGCGTPTTCGNGRRDGVEVCDANDFGGLTCGVLAMGTGALTCAGDCLSYSTTSCDTACVPACGANQCGLDPVCGTLNCGTCTTGTCEGGVCVDPDGPRILSLNSNVNTISPGEAVLFTAVVTDPDGIDDLIGGDLMDPISGSTYGVFATSAAEGSYSLNLTWNEINTVRAIDFTSSESRAFRARFYDQAGHTTIQDRPITLTCGTGPACDGYCGETRCGIECVDLTDDDDHCGACNDPCDFNTECSDSDCYCPYGYPDFCDGIGCVELSNDGSNCGECGVICPSDNCDYGRCSCLSSTCPGGQTCSEYDTGSYTTQACFAIGGGAFSGSTSSMSGVAELEVDGEYIAICDWQSGYDFDTVLCDELHGDATVDSFLSDQEIDPSLGVYVDCVGDEAALADCTISFEYNCPFDEGFLLTCGTGGTCTPDCDGRECGSDGCDGTCAPGCTSPAWCDASGTCQTGVPPTWTCDTSYYNQADGCDCECGAVDPDCALGGQELYNCINNTDYVCNDEGHCEAL